MLTYSIQNNFCSVRCRYVVDRVDKGILDRMIGPFFQKKKGSGRPKAVEMVDKIKNQKKGNNYQRYPKKNLLYPLSKLVD